MFPDLALPAPGEDSSLSISLGEYGVVGRWDLGSTGLVVKVREIREWPVRTFVRDTCGGGYHHFVVGDDELAARGSLIIRDGQWLLRTKSGVIVIHGPNADDGALVDPATGEVIQSAYDNVLRVHEVVVIGEWKASANEIHMEASKFVRVKTVCEPPKPPRQPILPGEIAALGTLVFENGRPFLNTPQGRIVLLTRNDVPGSEPQPVDPSFFERIAPEVMDAAGASADEDGVVRPDIARPVRHILVVGKWQLMRDHLAIVVRYALPWPYPYPQPVDPMPAPQPVPSIYDYPLPLPPVTGAPVDPMPVPVRPELGQPGLFGGFGEGIDGDIVIIEPEEFEIKELPVTGVNRADGVSVSSFSSVVK
jgi:hypothetical protein